MTSKNNSYDSVLLAMQKQLSTFYTGTLTQGPVRGAYVSPEQMEAQLKLEEGLLNATLGAKTAIVMGIDNMSAVNNDIFDEIKLLVEQNDAAGIDKLVGEAQGRIKELKSRIYLWKALQSNEAYMKRPFHGNDDPSAGSGSLAAK